ncbi:MAG: hypothetical protein M1G31_28030 [Pseudanabaena sp. Salubria-1]|nr:hypothetical protein [Pseudanabaena sp. Salubria-1]
MRWLAQWLIVNRTLRLNEAAKKIANGEWHQPLLQQIPIKPATKGAN